MSRWMGCLLLAGCVLASAASSGRAAEEKLLNKLYVLMVFDTNDEDLKPSLKVDKSRMLKMLEMTIPSNRYEAVTVEGAGVTGTKILAAVKTLKKKVTSNDAVLFFYGGHGAVNDKYGHVLKMSVGGPDLARSEVRKELEKLGAGLTVMLTDCCSTKEKGYDGEVIGTPFITRDVGIHPTVKQLFFQSRGVVDVTGATEDEAAWSDDKNGGLFTRSLVKMLMTKPEDLLKERDAAVTWGRFFPLLQSDTQTFFKSWKGVMLARYPDAHIRAERQMPHAFFLGQKSAYGVVEIENGKATRLKYKFRWESDDEQAPWSDYELEPGKRKAHVLPAKAGARSEDLPRLEILREGVEASDFLTSRVWLRDRPPVNTAFYYRIKK